MNQPNKFKIKKPRITLSDEQKNQARAGMAGEAVKATLETASPVPVNGSDHLEQTPSPVVEVAETTVQPVPLPIALVQPLTPEEIIEQVTEEIPARQGRGTRGKKQEKNTNLEAEDSETQHIRMSQGTVLKAKMNILLLPRSFGIKNLRDYGDAAFAFYDAHLRKTGKLPN